MEMIVNVLISLTIASILGIYTGLKRIKLMAQKRTAQNGSWRINLNTGSKDANFYERATVAAVGLFGLNKKEVVYFTTFRDSQGRPLNSKNSYRLEGKTFDARWWSITTYGHDHYLIPNKLDRYSYNSKNILLKDDGSYMIHLSTEPQGENWLPVGNRGNFSITIRLYNPAKSVYENPAQIDVPQILKEAI